MSAGYYRFPTIHDDTIIFVSEDDLWRVPAQGGLARRLTSNSGAVTYPMLSPDGQRVAFVGREEGGSEIYVMDAEGGREQRLTYLNSNCQVVGWRDARQIIFSSDYGQVNRNEMGLFIVDVEAANGAVTPLAYGPARAVAFGPEGAVVLGRNTGDPARWKRYRGGTAGHLWIDSNGDGEFHRFLSDLPGNIAAPMWLTVAGQPRIFFLSDHEGIGNLYSCRVGAEGGSDIQRHTDHESYYVRNPSTDGRTIVYHLGADLYIYRPDEDREARVDVAYRSPRIQRNRKFVDAGRYMDGYDLHPSGLAVAITSRGKAFGFFNHEGAVIQYGKRDGVRYRCPEWLWDGKRFVVVTDEPGEETLEIFGPEPYGESVRVPSGRDGLNLGRVVAFKASPIAAKVALSNHRYELLLVDLDTQTVTLVDRSPFRNIAGFDWSPDGRWLAYSYGATSQTSEIRLYQLAGDEEEDNGPPTGETDTDTSAEAMSASEHNNPLAQSPQQAQIHRVTAPVLHDVQPAFDPAGKYLYFLSYREFNPVYDALHFDLGFPWGMRPYLLTLRKDLPNPFVPRPEFGGDEDDDASDENADNEDLDNEDANNEEETDDAGAGDEGEEESPEDEYEEDEYDDGDDEWLDEEDEGDDFGDADNRAQRGWAYDAARRARSKRRLRAYQVGDESDSDETESGDPDSDRGDAARADETGDSAEVHVTPGELGQEESSARRDKHGPKPMRIDLEGIQQRVMAFPVPDARYGQIAGIRGKAIFTVFPVTGQLDNGHDWDDEAPETGELRAYDFKEYKNELLADRVSSFEISANGKKLLYAGGGQLRVINAGEKAPGGGPPRKSGWIPLQRVKVSVDPQSEWEQMFREAWRLQRDQFWTEDMSQVDWQTVYTRYFELIPRISTRSELSDLLWEMQGELGTSHAYEFGGDYRPRPYYGQGFLGAEFTWDAEQGGYRVDKILSGDPWNPEAHSPLMIPGANVEEGDILININGQMLDADVGPGQLLVNQARHEVLLVFRRPTPESAANGDSHEESEQVQDESNQGKTKPSASKPSAGRNKSPRYISVVTRTLSSERQARYRQWVNMNRRRVHEASDGRIGYVHIPDMGAAGYAEFHRGYLAEVDRDGLIVDVRYNGGGHVSQLILEKLARRRIGYDLSRWGGLIPYPMESVAGPIVALTNEHAGSDGDIFCHSFKLMKLGPLIGRRTWGGVIGISPQHALVDGSVTTQPEYSFWFEDVGWNVENYGTDPDIEVDNRPQDFVAGVDAQLEQAIAEALRLLEASPIRRPPLDQRPSRALPKLPPRTPLNE